MAASMIAFSEFSKLRMTFLFLNILIEVVPTAQLEELFMVIFFLYFFHEHFSLMLSMLGKNFSRKHLEYFFFFFPRKQALTFHASCLLRRQFAWNVRACFLVKI